MEQSEIETPRNTHADNPEIVNLDIGSKFQIPNIQKKIAKKLEMCVDIFQKWAKYRLSVIDQANLGN